MSDRMSKVTSGGPKPTHDPVMRTMVDAVQDLSRAREVGAVQAIVRTAARALVGSDGSTFVLRDGDQCFYADEDAIAPLWKGQRFPLEACISGWSMLHREAVVIPDIYADDRIPHEAYRPTFVKSLVMVPIRGADPIGAIGNYWATEHEATDDQIELLQALANSTAVAMENIAVHQELEARVADRTAALAQANSELKELSLVDDLTGLQNRRGFMTLAELEMRVLRRAGRRGAVVFVDVDGLKTLNDKVGHEAGDHLLRLVAAGLRSACREADVLARVGGDEFVALLGDVDEPLERVAERIRDEIVASGRDARGLRPSVSIGFAMLEPRGGDDLQDVITAADAAMYADKQRRRRARPFAS